MQLSRATGTAVIGAGNIGRGQHRNSCAYYLAMRHGIPQVALLDQGDPIAMTSAQSGENY